jgi:UDP-N-acetylglucosamine transferase subunit ALG13
MPGPAPPRVVVTVGTDHHHFDRLIGWINDWLGQYPEQAGAVFVQSGAASVRPACAGERFLDADQLDAVLDGADVVVCHGGPGSIADAWARGHLPIVVPRLRRHGEAVDDHQVDFCVKLAGLGRVRLAWTPTALAEFLNEATRGDLRPRAGDADADVEAAVTRFGTLVDDLVSQPRRRPDLLNRAWRICRRPSPHARTPTTVGSLPPGHVPEQPTNWRASHSPARVGVSELPKEEQE